MFLYSAVGSTVAAEAGAAHRWKGGRSMGNKSSNSNWSKLNWSKIMDEAAAGQTPPASEPVSSLENKGIRFEDLIEKLIRAMFPGEKWRRNGKSYDGKKDFVFPAEESLPDQKWAECKNYKSNLSLNVIAPTLIMGAIEDINTIFFFSYSPLNDNAVDNLLRYPYAKEWGTNICCATARRHTRSRLLLPVPGESAAETGAALVHAASVRVRSRSSRNEIRCTRNIGRRGYVPVRAAAAAACPQTASSPVPLSPEEVGRGRSPPETW